MLLRQLVATLGYDESEVATEWFLTQMHVATVAAIPALRRSYRNNGPCYDCVGALADLLAASREPERHAKHVRRSLKAAAAEIRRRSSSCGCAGKAAANG